MKRELRLIGNEDSGFDSVEEAYAWCRARSHITYAKIGKANRYHVIVSSFDHWSNLVHWVAIYQVSPSITFLPENEQCP